MSVSHNMHIAICMWGILRSLHFTLPSLQKHIFSILTLAGHSYDIYIHTYKVEGIYSNARSNEIGVAFNHSEWKLLDPFYLFIEEQKDFDERLNMTAYLHPHGNPWSDEGTYLNHLRALNSIYHVTHALETVISSTNRTYNAVVFIRPDLQLLNDLPVDLLHKYPHNTIFTPDFHRSCKGDELNDRFAMGRYPYILRFGKRLDSAWQMSRTQPLHSETLTNFHVHYNNQPSSSSSLRHHYQQVQIVEIPFRFHRIRSTGIPSERDERTVLDPTPYYDPSKSNFVYLFLSYLVPKSWLNKQHWVLRLAMWIPPLSKGWDYCSAFFSCHPHNYLTPPEIALYTPIKSWEASHLHPSSQVKFTTTCNYRWTVRAVESSYPIMYTHPVTVLDPDLSHGHNWTCHFTVDSHRHEQTLCLATRHLPSVSSGQLQATEQQSHHHNHHNGHNLSTFYSSSAANSHLLATEIILVEQLLPSSCTFSYPLFI